MIDKLDDTEQIKKMTDERTRNEESEMNAASCSDIEKNIVSKLNKKHAVTLIGNRVLILTETFDPVLKHKDVIFLSTQDFKNLYANQFRTSGTKNQCIADIWLKSEMRRYYKGIVFSPGEDTPGYYNLYQGLAIKPKNGDWNSFRAHIYSQICDCNSEHLEWLLAWMAHIVQNVGGARPGTAVLLRGRQGTGKGVFVNQFGKIFGPHFLQIVQQNQLTGRFNSHLKSAIVVFCDEAIWGGNKQAEGALKGLVTEDHLVIEPKGKDLFTVNNHVRLILATNNEWGIPAGMGERRFLVLDVSDRHEQDHIYFKEIIDQMDNGGREAMLYDLRHMDISGFNLRAAPKTRALFDQIMQSMLPIEKFWFEILNDGFNSVYDGPEFRILKSIIISNAKEPVIPDRETGLIISLDNLHVKYVSFCQRSNIRYRQEKATFSKSLRDLVPDIKSFRATYQRSKRTYLYTPSLTRCREYFENRAGVKIPWSMDINFDDETGTA